MKDFKKMHKNSEWVALVNYQLSDTEKQLMDKDEKTDAELLLMGELHKKFESQPST